MLSIGLMSGTSMDGIDAALLETDGSAEVLKELGDISIAYPQSFKILLKAAEYSVRRCLGNMSEAESYYQQGIQDYLKTELKIDDAERFIQRMTLSEVIQHSTDLHIQAVEQLLKKTGYQVPQIDVIGYHGQTLFHRPSQKISIIVGEGQRLANALGITVVNDFRRRDVEEGGQGAPFAPLYHHALAVRDQKIPIAVVNCGGIANITLINSANELDLIAFDTGPGNGLIDCLVRQRTQGREHMDRDGKYGHQGQVHSKVLAALYAASIIKDNQNYFSAQPPKSLDIGDMALVPELNALSLEDACATLEAFTADSIVKSLALVQGQLPCHWILAGGGWYNPIIRRELGQRLQRLFKVAVQIQTADEAGWNSRAMEAQIFAYLAVRSLQGKPISMPGTTGVPRPLCGGQQFSAKLALLSKNR